MGAGRGNGIAGREQPVPRGQDPPVAGRRTRLHEQHDGGGLHGQRDQVLLLRPGQLPEDVGSDSQVGSSGYGLRGRRPPSRCHERQVAARRDADDDWARIAWPSRMASADCSSRVSVTAPRPVATAQDAPPVPAPKSSTLAGAQPGSASRSSATAAAVAATVAGIR